MRFPECTTENACGTSHAPPTQVVRRQELLVEYPSPTRTAHETGVDGVLKVYGWVCVETPPTPYPQKNAVIVGSNWRYAGAMVPTRRTKGLVRVDVPGSRAPHRNDASKLVVLVISSESPKPL